MMCPLFPQSLFHSLSSYEKRDPQSSLLSNPLQLSRRSPPLSATLVILSSLPLHPFKIPGSQKPETEVRSAYREGIIESQTKGEKEKKKTVAIKCRKSRRGGGGQALTKKKNSNRAGNHPTVFSTRQIKSSHPKKKVITYTCPAFDGRSWYVARPSKDVL